MNIMNIMKSRFGIIVVVVVIAAIGSFIFVKKQVVDTTAPLLVGNNAIYVSDAKPATNVRVGFVILAGGGYVVVHQDSEGKPGAIIGNSDALPQGESRDFEITLSRESIDGETLYAMLHSENGDGAFNPAEDTPIKDDRGNIVLMNFLVLSGAVAPDAISL